MRDYALGTTFNLKFTTRKFTTGAPFTLAGSPVVAAYPDSSNTEITAGVTLGVDHDSKTGLNNVNVVATSGNGFASGSNYALVITTGTVDGVSVVGEVIGEFSIEAQSPLRPTTTGNTLDVSLGAVQANLVSGNYDTIAIVVWEAQTSGFGTDGSFGQVVRDNLDAPVSTRLASSSITISGGIVSADIKKVKGTTVTGSGTAGSPWGP